MSEASEKFKEGPGNSVEEYVDSMSQRITLWAEGCNRRIHGDVQTDPIDRAKIYTASGQDILAFEAMRYSMLLGPAVFEKDWDMFKQHLSKAPFTMRGIFRHYAQPTLSDFTMVALAHTGFRVRESKKHINTSWKIQYAVWELNAGMLLKLFNTLLKDPEPSSIP